VFRFGFGNILSDATIPTLALSEEILREIVGQHGLSVRQITPLRSTGVVNSVYALDDAFVLRVANRGNADALCDTLTEAVAVPAACAGGVSTPRLVVFDNSHALVDFPYTIYERVHGETLGLLDEPADIHHAWIALGRDLAKLHSNVTVVDDPANWLDTPGRIDLRNELDALASAGVLIPTHARWFAKWLDRLAPMALAPMKPRFLHNDLQSSNIMVNYGSYAYLAMIDWGDAGWGDSALELQWMDFRAVPFVMKGYREVQPFDEDETVEARILWDQIMNVLRQLAGSLKSGRPRASYAVELLRFTLVNSDSRFRHWLP